MSSRGDSREYPIRTRRARPPSDDFGEYPNDPDRDSPHDSASRRRAESRNRDEDDRSMRSGRPGKADYLAADRSRERDQEKSRTREPDMDRSRRRAGSDTSDRSITGQYVKHRNGQVEFIPVGEDRAQRPGKRDDRYLRSDGDSERPQRPRSGRDDFEPRNAPPSRSRRDHYDDDEPRSNGRRIGASPGEDAAVGLAGAGAGYAAAKGRRPPSGRDYDDFDGGRYGERPPPRRWRRGSGQYDDLGYDSERPRPSRRAYDDDGYGGRVGKDGYGQTSVRRPRGDPADRRRLNDYDDGGHHDRRRADDRGELRRTKSDRRPLSDRERDHRRGDKDRRDRHGGKDDWTAQGLALFQTHAMPIIKREGMKKLSSFLASQR